MNASEARPARAAIAPDIGREAAFLEMLADFEANDPGNAPFYAIARTDFGAYVQSLLDEEQGLNLREGWVPCSHRWLLDEADRLVGVTRLRHHIDTPFLAENGGHIGYDVAPSHRGRGFGTYALRVALDLAAERGLTRVLLYAAETNTPSRAVIERCGGVLEAIRYSEVWDERLCKYWVAVRAPG